MDCLDLLRSMPSESVDHCITDPPYGVRSLYSVYDWGEDLGGQEPTKLQRATKHWQVHKPIYEQIRRVLKPNGNLAWSSGMIYYPWFAQWFGPHRVWALSRFGATRQASGHIWIVQDRERQAIRFPDRDGVIFYKSIPQLRDRHPCPKTIEEASFMVESLTRPNDIVIDPFCGLGSTLVACQRLGRRWIGCDLSPAYCEVALERLDFSNPFRIA